MTLNIIIRSILIGFFVAIPSPFLIPWLSGLGTLSLGAASFIGIYLLAFVGCLVMGLSANGKETKIAGAAKQAKQAKQSNETDDREQGAVKWFNVTKGFGFITRDTGEDIFVHYRSVRGDGRRTLREGQRVRFVVTEGDKGLQAEDVSVDE